MMVVGVSGARFAPLPLLLMLEPTAGVAGQQSLLVHMAILVDVQLAETLDGRTTLIEVFATCEPLHEGADFMANGPGLLFFDLLDDLEDAQQVNTAVLV